MSDSYSAPPTTTGGTGSGATPNPVNAAPPQGTVPPPQLNGNKPVGQGGNTSNGLPEGFDISSIDLNQHPGFQKHKSTMDSQIARLSQQFQQTQQYLQQEQMRANQYAAQLEAMQLEGADDYKILQHNHKKTQSELMRVTAQLQQMQNYINQQRFLQTVKQEYGVELPEDIQDPQEAVIALTKSQRDTIAQMKQQLADLERKAGAVSAANEESQPLGGGQPAVLSSIQAEYNQAMLRLDGQTADRLSRQAAAEGLELDRIAWLSDRKRD